MSAVVDRCLALLDERSHPINDTNAMVGFRGRYGHRWQYAMTDDEWVESFIRALGLAADEWLSTPYEWQQRLAEGCGFAYPKRERDERPPTWCPEGWSVVPL